MIKVLTGLVSGEASLPDLQMVTFSLCLQMAFSLGTERDLRYLFLFLWGHQSYWIRASPLWPHLTLITSLKGPSSNTVTLGVRASVYDGGGRGTRGGGDSIQSITPTVRILLIASPWCPLTYSSVLCIFGSFVVGSRDLIRWRFNFLIR